MEWRGHVYDIDVDECSVNTSICRHGSTCANIEGSFMCDCSSGFAGDSCETDINECLSAPCLNNGTCNNTIGSFNCVCAQTYTGKNCEKEPSASTGPFV
ncbi:hypothetical protein DPMN_098488 [Dreissena polymorpha]|uniref:EGF-like domain-containing protein n=1 Tax=Dreissena polymorpha TaxID=45954 RepID=A0A9D4R6D4_DREPO|nr:hypothetical protein DPMN_098488 [Dreissena polymorpha]